MLRGLVLLLLLANGLFFLWSQGHLAGAGFAPADEREPERLAQQIAPAAVVLTSPPQATQTTSAPAATASAAAAAAGTAAPADSATACWKADGLSPEQWAVWQARIKDMELPDSAWSVREEAGNGRWMVYMGRYDAAQLERKKGELSRRGIAFQELRSGPWAFGLSLGSFESEAAAEAGLEALKPQGVRTAKVALERPDLSRYYLQLPAITQAQHDALPNGGKRLQRCD